MWHRPGLLTAIADLLFLAGTVVLAVVAAMAFARLPWLPLREVAVDEPLRDTGREELRQALIESVGGAGFWTVDSERVRARIERLPWVRSATVRRVWPDRLALAIEEHRPVARWGSGSAQLLNDRGEVFYANSARPPRLQLTGPLGSAGLVLERYRDFDRALAQLGGTIAHLELSPRLAWRIRLEDGLLIELGREQARTPIAVRLRQFVAAYREVVARRSERPAVIDLRYANGFALRYAAGGGGVQRAFN